MQQLQQQQQQLAMMRHQQQQMLMANPFLQMQLFLQQQQQQQQQSPSMFPGGAAQNPMFAAAANGSVANMPMAAAIANPPTSVSVPVPGWPPGAPAIPGFAPAALPAGALAGAVPSAVPSALAGHLPSALPSALPALAGGGNPYSSNFVCESCNKSFTTRAHLKRHMRLHTGDRPYACDLCDSRFTRSDHLKAHKSSHRKRSKTGSRSETSESRGTSTLPPADSRSDVGSDDDDDDNDNDGDYKPAAPAPASSRSGRTRASTAAVTTSQGTISGAPLTSTGHEFDSGNFSMSSSDGGGANTAQALQQLSHTASANLAALSEEEMDKSSPEASCSPGQQAAMEANAIESLTQMHRG